ncbi:hypothetical protein AWH56_018235 [Anaerobacillus isosaccharinicus]|uniref:Lipoprotein n=2 Tax=Anaerobacillus isosaccharinicus TaxID=1532552 RepID=A0A7S7L579_9BACI|nr:hypothetical protein [Anaerobacillus isosaccharinicus]MBA5587155.1 hypothetical protein [Anaerobacillus isosaccharinicus]QOY34648.1 hypothetical protein AWH56_018235 [Anaerobacillus isosaccharinicus]
MRKATYIKGGMNRQMRVWGLLYLSILILLLGCTNTTIKGEALEPNQIIKVNNTIVKERVEKLEVQKRIGEDNKYELLREITNPEKVEKILLMLEKANWINAKVEMASPPNYKINNKYEIWLTPLNNMLEVVIPSQSKYIKLWGEEAAILFEIIADEKLNE